MLFDSCLPIAFWELLLQLYVIAFLPNFSLDHTLLTQLGNWFDWYDGQDIYSSYCDGNGSDNNNTGVLNGHINSSSTNSKEIAYMLYR